MRKSALLLLAAVCALKLVQAGETEPASGRELEAEAAEFNRDVRVNFKLPKMFDFERFKTAFHKTYGSAAEEMLRMKLFLGRSYEVFISAVEYRLRRSSYYKAINDRSDWTPAELAATHNRFAAAVASQNSGPDQLETSEDLPHEPLNLVEPDELEAELRKIRDSASDPRYAPLASELEKAELSEQSKAAGQRKRRSLPADQSGEKGPERPRDSFNVGDAFMRLDSATVTPQGQSKRKRRPTSNNPNWQQPELMSMGARKYSDEEGYKKMEELDVVRGIRRDFSHLPVMSRHKMNGFLGKLTNAFLYNSWFGSQLPKRQTDENPLPDVVWVDHRRSGCINPVQEQRRCSGCYAFASIAYMEWAHCNQTGELVKFSEQYMIDCGPMTSEWLDGCRGGALLSAGEFVSNFGLELASHYPYMDAEGTCPYDPETERESMGFIRVDPLTNVVKVGLEYAEMYLRLSPMLIYIYGDGNFEFYGGGVYDGKDCKEDKAEHGVLIIGHGREDGEEYWLIRDSRGPSWGEAGYMKLNKNSNCIHPRVGFIFRPSREWDIKLGVRENDKVQKSDV